MDVTGFVGLNDTPLLVTALNASPSDTPPREQRKTLLSKKWILQEDGSYKPIYLEKPSTPFVYSMIPRSMKPVESRPGATQTWGIVATLIKQQEQLNVSQLNTVDNSKDAICAFTNDSEEIASTDDLDDTLDTEHDVFSNFDIHNGDDPLTDDLDKITAEGTPVLRSRLRILLEKYRDVFSTTLSEYRPSNLKSIKRNGNSFLIEDTHVCKAPRNRLRS
jgi:hypothetical protein